MEHPDFVPQKTCVWGWITRETELPWKLLHHFDIAVMQEFENHYIHEETGATMVAHCWRYPRHVELWFYWRGREYGTERELIAATEADRERSAPANSDTSVL